MFELNKENLKNEISSPGFAKIYEMTNPHGFYDDKKVFFFCLLNVNITSSSLSGSDRVSKWRIKSQRNMQGSTWIRSGLLSHPEPAAGVLLLNWWGWVLTGVNNAECVLWRLSASLMKRSSLLVGMNFWPHIICAVLLQLLGCFKIMLTDVQPPKLV